MCVTCACNTARPNCSIERSSRAERLCYRLSKAVASHCSSSLLRNVGSSASCKLFGLLGDSLTRSVVDGLLPDRLPFEPIPKAWVGRGRHLCLMPSGRTPQQACTVLLQGLQSTVGVTDKALKAAHMRQPCLMRYRAPRCTEQPNLCSGPESKSFICLFLCR